MTKPLSGQFVTETIGWAHSSGTTGWILIPGTIVALGTIVIVLAVVARHADQAQGPPFDPSDTMHLLAAAAPGGLQQVFTINDEKGIATANDKRIVLVAEGRVPVLQGC